VGGGVQLGPLGTAATNRPIVPAPGDYDGEIGGMIGRGNANPGRRDGKPATNRLSYGTALCCLVWSSLWLDQTKQHTHTHTHTDM
jgi:hypothetical protein